jgi:ferritin-like metal-binding protein YciE
MSETSNTTENIRYDSAETAPLAGDERHALQTYLSDALALERHIAQPLGRQQDMGDARRYADAAAIISQLKATTDAHVRALEARLEALGGHAASPIKSAWSQFLGVGAAAIDGARKTKISKSLRDDYTALSLATISYTMLHATALALGDRETAALAKSHLQDYAGTVMDISDAMPAVVLEELRDDGENVSLDAAELARENATSAWRSSSRERA